MKKIIALLLIVTFSVSLIGCHEKEYELPWDKFCYKVNDENNHEDLDPDAKKLIVDILNSAEWTDEISCDEYDYIFSAKKQRIRYHTQCGTFTDETNNKSVTLCENDRVLINKAFELL